MNLLNVIHEINWLSVIVVTILSFAIGSFWHSPILFGRVWMEEVKYDMDKKVSFLLIFGLTAFLHFIAIAGMDAVIGRDAGMLSGLFIGLFISLIWVATAIGATYLFAARSFRLFLIDAGFYIVLFSISGLILGAW